MPTRKVTLAGWAELHFSPPPSLHTLRRMARENRITPQPILVGKTYYVEPTARVVDDEAAPPEAVGSLVDKLRGR